MTIIADIDEFGDGHQAEPDTSSAAPISAGTRPLLVYHRTAILHFGRRSSTADLSAFAFYLPKIDKACRPDPRRAK